MITYMYAHFILDENTHYIIFKSVNHQGTNL
jgi:hypothetical protein